MAAHNERMVAHGELAELRRADAEAAEHDAAEVAELKATHYNAATEAIVKKRREAAKLLLYNRLEELAHGPPEHCLNLFLYLWAITEEGKGVEGVRIPDTVLVQKGRAAHWLFTARDGTIKKKNLAKVEGKVGKGNILEAFCKGGSTDGANTVALHICPPLASPQGDARGGSWDVDSLDKGALQSTLNERSMADGLLQRHVRPYGDTNVLVSATWSPRFVVVERSASYASCCKPSNRRRGVHSETHSHLSKTLPLPQDLGTSVLQRKVERVCENVALHVRATSPQHYHISFMRLHFKSDIQGNLWLLWCSELSLDTEPRLPEVPALPSPRSMLPTPRTPDTAGTVPPMPHTRAPPPDPTPWDGREAVRRRAMKKPTLSWLFKEPAGQPKPPPTRGGMAAALLSPRHAPQPIPPSTLRRGPRFPLPVSARALGVKGCLGSLGVPLDHSTYWNGTPPSGALTDRPGPAASYSPRDAATRPRTSQARARRGLLSSYSYGLGPFASQELSLPGEVLPPAAPP